MTESGPVGGPGGSTFDDRAPADMEIGAVIIQSGSLIDGLRVLYRGAGQVALGRQIGGNGGSQTIFALNPGEFVVEVSGKTGAFVDSITFQTNQGRRFGRFGGSGGVNEYDLPPASTPEQSDGQSLGQQEVFGFFGRAARLIDAIGVHARPRP